MTNRIKSGKDGLEIELQVAVVKEGDCFVAYCPSLELTGYGDTITEAQESFDTALHIFLDDTSSKGTFEKVLISLGWELTKEHYQPPKLSYEALVMFKGSESIAKQRVLVP